MPSYTPYYHPTLVLGNIADTRVLEVLKQINACQAKNEAAQEKMNSLIMMKRSITMTINELADLNIKVDELQDKQTELDAEILEAAAAYLTAKIDNETQIQTLKETLSGLASQGDDNKETCDSIESPIDFNASKLKTLPFSAESIKFDSQFFSFGTSLQDDTLANVEKFVRSSTRDTGAHADTVSKAVTDQISNQFQNHGLSGTLIITASCTHRNIAVFDPLVLDPDKMVVVWNSLKADTIDTENLNQPVAFPAQDGAQNDVDALHLVTGACYGSSFVGMVHIINNRNGMSADMDKIKDQLDKTLGIGGWLQNAIGGIGVDESALNEVKAFLSTQSVSAHIGLVVMGAVPTIKSNNLQLTVKNLAQFDPAIVTAVESKTASAVPTKGTADSKAGISIESKRLVEIQNARTANMMKTLGAIDNSQNKAFDISTLMSAFENYIEAISANKQNVGVPINYYLKKITKPEIVKLWQNKYRKAIDKTDKS